MCSLQHTFAFIASVDPEPAGEGGASEPRCVVRGRVLRAATRRSSGPGTHWVLSRPCSSPRRRPEARTEGPPCAVGVGGNRGVPHRASSDEPPPHSCLRFPTKVGQNLTLKGPGKLEAPGQGRRVCQGCPGCAPAPSFSSLCILGVQTSPSSQRASVLPAHPLSPLPHSWLPLLWPPCTQPATFSTLPAAPRPAVTPVTHLPRECREQPQPIVTSA